MNDNGMSNGFGFGGGSSMGGSNSPIGRILLQQQLGRQMMQQPQQQGQMVGNQYVAPSGLSSAANLANAYLGSQLTQNAMNQYAQLPGTMQGNQLQGSLINSTGY
jgi:hypothetical protein